MFQLRSKTLTISLFAASLLTTPAITGQAQAKDTVTTKSTVTAPSTLKAQSLPGEKAKSPGATTSAKTPGYSFKQFSANYGNVQCWVTKDNFRMDALDVKMFVRRPFKSIVLYNLDSKLYYPMAVDNFAKRLTIRSLSAEEKKLGWKQHTDRAKEDDKKICGFNCSSYIAWQVNPKGTAHKTAQFWATNDIDLPREMAQACAKLTDCPPEIGFPFKITQFSKVTSKVTKKAVTYGYTTRPLLDTLNMTKMTLPDSMFAEPPGCRRARDEVEVIMGEDKN